MLEQEPDAWRKETVAAVNRRMFDFMQTEMLNMKTDVQLMKGALLTNLFTLLEVDEMLGREGWSEKEGFPEKPSARASFHASLDILTGLLHGIGQRMKCAVDHNDGATADKLARFLLHIIRCETCLELSMKACKLKLEESGHERL